MVNRVVAWSIFGCMIIALLLSLNGITSVGTSKNFYYFLSIYNEGSKIVSGWKIPNIPQIPQYTGIEGARVVEILRGIANALVIIINAIIFILNIIWSILLFIIVTISSIIEYIRYVTGGYDYIVIH